MKIKQLRFKNLNSLEGEWKIDFTAPEYDSEGLFVITGPTGVGKTTILDAICLALYGRTPRLDKVNASSNEIMSRQTGECFSEVTFSTAKGTYQCHWSQRRARGKAAGKLQSPKHEISNAETQEVIESMVSKISAEVEKACGMNFDRFTRSVLLAQGNFAKFLQSSADERSPILEQITGTSIYSEISKLVHQRKSEEDSRLKELQAEMSGIQLLDEETEASLKKESAELNTTVQHQNKERSLHQKSEQWLQSIHREKQTIIESQKQKSEHQKQLNAFAPDQEKLKLAKKANELEAEYRSLTDKKSTAAQQQKDLTTLNEKVTPLTKATQSAKTEATHAQAHWDTCQKQSEEAEPKLIEARKLANNIESLKNQLAEETDHWKTTQKKCKQTQSKIDSAQKDLTNIKSQEKDAIAYLSKHPAYANLQADFSGITQQVAQWKESLSQISTSTTTLKDQQKKLKKLKAKSDKEGKELAAAQQQAEASQTELTKTQQKQKTHLRDRSTTEIETELEHFEKQRQLEQRILALEDERARLINGSPCPLCGSKDHPFATHIPPELTETERAITKLKQTLKEIRDLEKAIQKQTLILQQAKAQISQNQERLDTTNKLITEQDATTQKSTQELTLVQQNSEKIYLSLTQAVSSYLSNDSAPITLETIDGVLETLKKNLEQWTTYSDTIDQAKEKKIQLAATITNETDNLKSFEESLDISKAKGEKIRSTLTTHQKSIQDLIGNNTVAHLEQQLKSAAKQAEANYQTKNKAREQSYTALSELKATIAQLTATHNQLSQTITTLSATLNEAILEKGFADFPAFLQARLPNDKRASLEQQQQSLQNKKTEIETRLSDAEKRLATEQEKQLTTLTEEELKEKITVLSEELKNNSEKLGAIQQQLADQQSAQSKLAEKLQTKIKLEKECARWNKLHGLIGSSDGKKFRNFAQGLTFEIMVRHANSQLAKMSDRYQLIRDKGAPLDLNVIDNYQAGEIRSTKNLSGGESFIISLALALGLSQMASHTVRVDSLFLDEGFGTLDEDSLEVALETLSSLNQEGKLIGIISHISALKERIPTQLELTPTQQGKATITGPGVGGRETVDGRRESGDSRQ